MNKAGTKMRGGGICATLSGVKDKSLSLEGSKKPKRYKRDIYYSEKGYGAPFGDHPYKAFIQLSVDELRELIRARVITWAGALALLLHRQADMRRWPVVKLPIALLNSYGFDRKTASRALQQLERAGLVRVHRKPGRRSTVTLLRHPIRDVCFVVGEDEEDEL